MFSQFRQQHSVFQAALIVLMMTGSESARIQVKAPSANGLEQLVQSHEGDAARGESDTWLANIGGHDVCRQKDLDGTKSLERYRHKIEKVKGLAAQLEEKACGKSCPHKWLDLKLRMEHFLSCAELMDRGNESEVVTELQKAMTTGDASLTSMHRSAMGALSVILKKYGVFPKFDDLAGCQFNPANLDIENATKTSDPEDTVHKQLFGLECNEEDAKKYVPRLKGNAQQIARKVIEQAEQALSLTRHAKNATETAQETKDIVTKLSQQLDEHDAEADEEAEDLMASGALLEVGESGSLKFSDLIEDLANGSAQSESESLDESSGKFDKFLKFLTNLSLIFVVFVLLMYLMTILFLLTVWSPILALR